MNNSNEVQAVLNAARENCIGDELTGVLKTSRNFCDIIFDGLMCWPETPAGSIAQQSCSNDYIKSTIQGVATRICTINGTWFTPSNSRASWTNYTLCGKFYMLDKSQQEGDFSNEIYSQWLPVIKNITHFGYVLSIICLILSLLIFIRIQRLHCARNTLHTNLFLSFVMRGLMSLIKDGLFVKGTALHQDIEYVNGEPNFNKDNYSWACKTIISLQHYSIISNYIFLLMEGAYLHNLMYLDLFSRSGVLIYCILGWGVPICFIIPWIILKAHNEDKYCWTNKINKYVSLLIEIPIGLSVIINFILFMVIIRVLSIKLTSMYMQQKRIKYKKLLRATAILVPLFGVPYTISFILSFHVHQNQTFEILWLLFDQTFTAFQGFFASLVYCLLNSEVQIEIKRKYHSFKDRNTKEFKRSRTISTTQQMPLNDELMQEFHNYGGGGNKEFKKTKTDCF